MPLSREQVYNELNGEEIKEILIKRFAALLDDVPYLKRTITLARVRMVTKVDLHICADQDPHETFTPLDDDFMVRTVQAQNRLPMQFETRLSTSDIVDASPKTGKPPDQIRDEHLLPTTEPVRGTGGYIEDRVVPARLPAEPPGPPVHLPITRDGKNTTYVQDNGPMRERTQYSVPELLAKNAVHEGVGRGVEPPIVRDEELRPLGQLAPSQRREE